MLTFIKPKTHTNIRVSHSLPFNLNFISFPLNCQALTTDPPQSYEPFTNKLLGCSTRPLSDIYRAAKRSLQKTPTPQRQQKSHTAPQAFIEKYDESKYSAYRRWWEQFRPILNPEVFQPSKSNKINIINPTEWDEEFVTSIAELSPQLWRNIG